jgi:proline iminopeptidase
MPDRFPALEPYDSGLLDVGDGQQLYWECCGNPSGKPALYLHGGPGAGSSPGARRYFDPDAYRIVLFDQRGAGRSLPRASSPEADLTVNTTQHLIADIETLREHLSIEQWAAVLGISWGTTLGLAYAQMHRERVQALVLALVTTTSRSEVEWITQDCGRIFPREWDRFVAAVPAELRHMRPVDAYAALLRDLDPAVHQPAARAWCAWEDTHVSLAPGHTPDPRFEDPEFSLRFARLVTHYWSNSAFLEEDQLLRDAHTLNDLPGVLIHGRYDVSSPLMIPWRLSQLWTTSRLYILEDMGHGHSLDDAFPIAVTRALNEFATD